jgi:hypothetical protein
VAGVDTSQQTPTERTARLLRLQAAACRSLGSPLYADLLDHAAADLLAGGPVSAVLAGHLADPGPSALALRMLGGAHALALSGRAPTLAACYPSAGGTLTPEPGSPRAWAALRQTLTEHRAEIRTWLERPPQTNEVGRAAALLGGLRHLAAEAALPIHLIEVGASAGLNLRADHFCVPGDAGSFGDPASPVVLRGGWQGVAPPEAQVQVLSRTGGDLDPVDPVSAGGKLTLTAYVWPDQADRLERLRGALALAARVPAELRRESASETLAKTSLTDGCWTVLWHSIFRQYLNPEQRADMVARIEALAATATQTARFGYVYLEQSRDGPCKVALTTWPGGRWRVLGTAPAHGLPVHWHRADRREQRDWPP